MITKNVQTVENVKKCAINANVFINPIGFAKLVPFEEPVSFLEKFSSNIYLLLVIAFAFVL